MLKIYMKLQNLKQYAKFIMNLKTLYTNIMMIYGEVVLFKISMLKIRKISEKNH